MSHNQNQKHTNKQKQKTSQRPPPARNITRRINEKLCRKIATLLNFNRAKTRSKTAILTINLLQNKTNFITINTKANASLYKNLNV